MLPFGNVPLQVRSSDQFTRQTEKKPLSRFDIVTFVIGPADTGVALRTEFGAGLQDSSARTKAAMSERRLRVGLVGCGQIADAHLQQIRRIASADLIAVCDVESLLARQAAERFEVPGQYLSVAELIDKGRLDVVHVTTPVHTHAAIAKELLTAGVHVYVEKPFTVDAAEAREVLEVARRQERLVCLGHDQLFDPLWLECRARVAAGEIGEVQHVDSVLGYPLDGPFGALVLHDPSHWVRRLPGGLFQNTISHPLYRITDFLTDPVPLVSASWFSKSQNSPMPTELRVQLRGDRVSAGLLFTGTTRPFHRLTYLYGTKAGLEVDFNAQQIRCYRSERLPGALGKLESSASRFFEAAGNLRRTLGKFCCAKLHYFAGMKMLFEQFYQSIQDGTPLPIEYAEMLRVTELMDRIFADCRDEVRRNAAPVNWPSEKRMEDDMLETLTQVSEMFAAEGSSKSPSELRPSSVQ